MDALFSGCKQVEEASRAGSGPKVRAMILSCHMASHGGGYFVASTTDHL